ncbi:ribonuclease H-like protein [Tothia fuscella]|uniref:ribonuclease H n=1 Tax=Tothia fuscella TaxID=1048955 RepID=A0A9P4NHX7_9PEZI|nr:ribonuclease H-like protein [Tothia fuscella]
MFGGGPRGSNAAHTCNLPHFPSISPANNFTRFTPPNPTDTPNSLFDPRISSSSIPAPRFVRKNNPKELLIYTAGASLNNGSTNATAGFAFVFRPAVSASALGSCHSRLENKGPTGEAAPQTSNRAELRAVIAALQFRYWCGEGFNRLVIATDSSYTVEGCTSSIRTWQRNGWQTSMGKSVVNWDLWEVIIKETEKWSKEGLQVQFWLIPKALNSVAEGLANQGAAEPACEKWNEIKGAAC